MVRYTNFSATRDAPQSQRLFRNSNSNVTYFVNCFFACSVAESSAEYTAFYNGRMGSRIEVAYKQERISRDRTTKDRQMKLISRVDEWWATGEMFN